MQLKAQIKEGSEYSVVKRTIIFVNWDFNWRFREAEVPNALAGERLSATGAV